MLKTQLIDEINDHTAEELPDLVKEMGGAVPANIPENYNYTGGALPESQPPPRVESQPIKEIEITEDLYLRVETPDGEKKTYENWSHILFNEQINTLLDRVLLSPSTLKIRSYALKLIGAASSKDDVFWCALREIASNLLDRDQN